MKNVILILVDQMRYDCLGLNSENGIFTPNLDMLASKGINFRKCYSAVPTCIAARASLMTGLSPKNHHRVGYQDGVVWDYKKTMANEFGKLGYQTQAIGKMHVYPERNRIGFDNVILHDGYLHANRVKKGLYAKNYEYYDDYLNWLKAENGYASDIIDSGISCNSWVSRTWIGEERYHPTNWVTDQAIEFFKKHDPMNPFFLNISYVRPHSPLDPPEFFNNLYSQTTIEYPIGKWVLTDINNKDTEALEISLNKDVLMRTRRAYYGLISHIDNQIGKLLIALEESGEKENTIIAFASDHGDQLGEHNLFRKGFPYQGSVHVPFFIYDPSTDRQQQNSDKLMELRDVFPTLIKTATNQCVENIDGVDIMNNKDTREYIHGEHSLGKYSNHYIVTSKWKYIWFDQTNIEQLFNLENDPNECNNIFFEQKEIARSLRKKLIEELSNREENYVSNNELVCRRPRVEILKR
ncbi:MAG: arylsulfatase [Erysipelotrichaceae bacterium]